MVKSVYMTKEKKRPPKNENEELSWKICPHSTVPAYNKRSYLYPQRSEFPYDSLNIEKNDNRGGAKVLRRCQKITELFESNCAACPCLQFDYCGKNQSIQVHSKKVGAFLLCTVLVCTFDYN